ncbi:MAG: hypothetical protein LBP36_03500, partial [Oscillospiraceae bacterium]|nr:hypothetical protein [Oscillospiraceae bacterium]
NRSGESGFEDFERFNRNFATIEDLKNCKANDPNDQIATIRYGQLNRDLSLSLSNYGTLSRGTPVEWVVGGVEGNSGLCCISKDPVCSYQVFDEGKLLSLENNLKNIHKEDLIPFDINIRYASGRNAFIHAPIDAESLHRVSAVIGINGGGEKISVLADFLLSRANRDFWSWTLSEARPGLNSILVKYYDTGWLVTNYLRTRESSSFGVIHFKANNFAYASAVPGTPYDRRPDTILKDGSSMELVKPGDNPFTFKHEGDYRFSYSTGIPRAEAEAEAEPEASPQNDDIYTLEEDPEPVNGTQSYSLAVIYKKAGEEEIIQSGGVSGEVNYRHLRLNGRQVDLGFLEGASDYRICVERIINGQRYGAIVNENFPQLGSGNGDRIGFVAGQDDFGVNYSNELEAGDASVKLQVEDFVEGSIPSVIEIDYSVSVDGPYGQSNAQRIELANCTVPDGKILRFNLSDPDPDSPNPQKFFIGLDTLDGETDRIEYNIYYVTENGDTADWSTENQIKYSNDDPNNQEGSNPLAFYADTVSGKVHFYLYVPVENLKVRHSGAYTGTLRFEYELIDDPSGGTAQGVQRPVQPILPVTPQEGLPNAERYADQPSAVTPPKTKKRREEVDINNEIEDLSRLVEKLIKDVEELRKKLNGG